MTTKKSSAQKVKKQDSSAKSVKKVVTTPKTHHELWMKIGRWLIIVASIIVLLGVAVRIAFDVSPWPKALIIRHLFDEGGAKTKKASTTPALQPLRTAMPLKKSIDGVSGCSMTIRISQNRLHIPIL